MCCIKIALRCSFFEKTVQSIANGTDKGGSFVTVVRLETKLRATLTEQQKAPFEQIKKNGCRNYDRHELQAFTNGFRFASRLYEDNVLGRINNEQFRMLSCGYTDEQKSIDAKLPELKKQIQNLQQAASDVDKFIGLAKKYTRITDLTSEILHTFVSKIVIHERRERFKQNTEQQIDIYFRYIGNVAEM